MAEEKRMVSKHSVSMERRESISVTGVLDVLSFDEETVIADTDMGVIILRGENLHVNRLNLDSGDLEVDGDIISLTYEDQNTYGKSKSSLFGKLFK